MTTRYLTVPELKAYVRTEIASADDTAYEAAINTAETIIDNATGRKFVVASGASNRVYRPTGGNLLIIDDCTTITSVTDNGATLTSGTDYQAEPLNGLSSSGESVPYYILRRLGYYYNCWYNWYGIPGAATITVNANWGWTAIPAQIKEACKIIAKDVFQQRDVAHGIIGVSDVGGVGTRENRIVQETLMAYQHPNAIAAP